MARAASSATRTDSSAMRLLVSITCCSPSRTSSIVEDHAQGMAMAGAQPAHAVTQGHSIVAARALLRPAIDREYHCIALPERPHLGSRLHARALLDQHKLAAGEVPAGRG